MFIFIYCICKKEAKNKGGGATSKAPAPIDSPGPKMNWGGDTDQDLFLERPNNGGERQIGSTSSRENRQKEATSSRWLLAGWASSQSLRFVR